MKLFFAFALIAAVAADVSHLPSNEYLPPQQEASYAPAVASYSAPAPAPAPVSYAAPTSEYLPPTQQYSAPIESAPVEAAPAHELAADGYRYKTHRRVVYRRNRRDVSHLPSNEYLPPQQEATYAPAPAPAVATYSAPAPAPAPVSYAAPTTEYLPPTQQYSAPIESAPVEAAPAHELAADGYRYKTHRRVVYRRNRRDVSHLPSNEYLPPQQEATYAPAPAVASYSAPAPAHVSFAAPAPAPAPVSYAAPTTEYLPPTQQYSAPIESAPVEAAPAHELAADGYRYKTQRRVVYRRRH